MEVNKIICGDALTILKTFPDESIDMVMTSPPYYGARDYGEETKTIWGGDPKCEHEFTISTKATIGNNSMIRGKNEIDSGAFAIPKFKKTGMRQETKIVGAFCKKCGAWYGQLGLEPTYHHYIENLLKITEQIKRVLKKTGSFYLNIGDCYSSGHSQFDTKNPKPRSNNPKLKEKNLPTKTLIGIPWRIALKMIDEQGWRLRNAIIWYKPNHMPSSVKDRLTNTYEFLFHFVKSKKYYYNLDAIRVPMINLPYRKDKGNWQRLSSKYEGIKSASMSGNEVRTRKKWEIPHHPKGEPAITGMRRPPQPNQPGAFHPRGKNPGDTWKILSEGENLGDYWEIPTKPNFDKKELHFALFPEKLCEKPILSSCPKDGIVLDPFVGLGTTCIVAKKLKRKWLGIDIKEEYCQIAREKIRAIPEPLL